MQHSLTSANPVVPQATLAVMPQHLSCARLVTGLGSVPWCVASVMQHTLANPFVPQATVFPANESGPGSKVLHQ